MSEQTKFATAMKKLKTKSKYNFEKFVKLLYTRDEMSDIVEHGMSGGFHSATYYWETEIIHDLWEKELWDLAYNVAQDMGVKSVMDIIAQSPTEVNSLAELKNWMVWFGIENTVSNLIGG